MDYKEATDRLFERITAEDLAAELGVSQNAIARARLAPDTRGYRPPPANWQAAVATVAERRSRELVELSLELKKRL